MDVFDLFAKLSLDSSEYEQGLSDAENKGSNFGANLAGATKVGITAIAAVGTAAVATGASFVKGAGDVASYGDNIDKMSQKMGISAQAYQEWDAVMQHSGTTIEALKPSMKTLAQQAEKGSDAFQKLGISEEEVATMSQEDLFSAVISGLQGMEEGTERTAITAELLGRGATELGALLNTSAEETQAMKDRVHELGGVMSDDAVKASAAFQDQLQDMQTGFAGLKRGMMSDFLPSLTTVMGGLTEIFAGNYDEGLSKITDGINNVVKKLTDVMPQMLTVGVNIVKSLAKAIIDNLPTIMPTLVSLVMDIGNMIIENLPLLIETGLEIILQIATGIAEALPELIPTIVDIIIEVVGTIIDNVDLFIDAAIQLVLGLIQGIVQALPILIAKLPELIQKVIDAIVNNIPVILQAIVQINMAILQAIIENLPLLIKATIQIIGQIASALVTNAPQILKAILDTFGEILSQFGTFGGEILDNVGQSLADLAQSVWQGMKNMFDKFVEWLSQLPSEMAYWIGYAVGQFIDGIIHLPENLKEIFDAVIEKVLSFGKDFKDNAEQSAKDFFNNLVNGIKELPAKMVQFAKDLLNAVASLPEDFMNVGSNIVTGIWNGISAGWDWLVGKVKDLAGSLLQGAKDALGIESPSKEFAWVGKMVDEGFAKGINDNADLVTSAMDAITDVSDVVSDMDVTGASATAGAGTYIINVNQPVATPSEMADAIRLESQYGLILGGGLLA